MSSRSPATRVAVGFHLARLTGGRTRRAPRARAPGTGCRSRSTPMGAVRIAVRTSRRPTRHGSTSPSSTSYRRGRHSHRASTRRGSATSRTACSAAAPATSSSTSTALARKRQPGTSSSSCVTACLPRSVRSRAGATRASARRGPNSGRPVGSLPLGVTRRSYNCGTHDGPGRDRVRLVSDDRAITIAARPEALPPATSQALSPSSNCSIRGDLDDGSRGRGMGELPHH